MIDNDFLAHYKLVVEGIMMLVVAGIASMRIFSRTTDSAERMRIAFTDVSVLLFMAFFAGSEFFATSTDIYEINLYALLALPIFILSLTVAITSYGTMRLGDSAVKVLFYIFLILASTQFFYVNSLSDFFLTLMSFFVIVILGLLLFRSNEREIASRHKVEELATDLQSSNERQEGLIHFISHEVKGALGKAVNVYSMTLEGDYGVLPEKMQPLFTQGLHDTREAVDMVTAILLSSNLKSGQMKFDMKPFDMREATESVVNSLLPDAQRKGLTLSMHIPAGEYKINGDREIITKHVIRNLVDNSIRYTPTGSVTVSVARRAGVIVLSVEDTGVGISDEDKARLFTEGGRGKESVKVNVNSTGYGLFFAKQLVDAHKGTVRAESDGPGKT
jgi:signal transduction histidine kinase